MARTAVLTRPGDRHAALAQRLRQAGWCVLSAPALQIEPLNVPDVARFDPSHFDLIVFVSGNAARAYADALGFTDSARLWPENVAIAAVGAVTLREAQRVLRLSSRVPRYAPAVDAPSHDSEALYEALRLAGGQPRRVLIVRGLTGRQWLADRLRADGSEVEMLALYSRAPAVWSDDTHSRLARWHDEGRALTWLFTSAESLQAVAQQIQARNWSGWWSDSSVVVTHPRLVPAWHSYVHGAKGVAEDKIRVCLPDDDGIFEAFVAV